MKEEVGQKYHSGLVLVVHVMQSLSSLVDCKLLQGFKIIWQDCSMHRLNGQ